MGEEIGIIGQQQFWLRMAKEQRKNFIKIQESKTAISKPQIFKTNKIILNKPTFNHNFGTKQQRKQMDFCLCGWRKMKLFDVLSLGTE